MKELGDALCQISGFPAVTLQPVAGAHGEYTAIMMIRAYHKKKGKLRSKILVPDSAHGTNPATTTLSGYQAVQIKSNAEGLVDLDDLKTHLDDEVAGLMLTNPNTVGLFEKNILEITKLVHQVGGLVFMDGANLNALMGIARPGDFGIDAMHFNLHKTFSTPHGGGGPGGGGVACTKELEPFLPLPVIGAKHGSESSKVVTYYLDYDRPDSLGKVHSFFGNFGVMIKAYVYIRMMGGQGLRQASENAIINANYIMRSLEGIYDLPFKAHCKHECVFSGLKFREKGVKTLDIAKRLLDYGYHAPTIYFPLIVPEAIMIEPTETESQETLDEFIAAMKKIAQEIETTPELVKSAPNNTPIGRLDDVKAAKEPRLRYGGKCL
jgi:glycine dehydrogenase subunit 2